MWGAGSPELIADTQWPHVKCYMPATQRQWVPVPGSICGVTPILRLNSLIELPLLCEHILIEWMSQVPCDFHDLSVMLLT